MNHIKEKVMEGVFLFTAVISIIAVALICVFLFANGFPAMQKIGVWQFLSGKVWKPTNNIFGIFPMILGSIYVTGGALLIWSPGWNTDVNLYGAASVRTNCTAF